MLSLGWPWLLAALPLPLLVAWLLPPATPAPPAAIRFPYPGLLQEHPATRRGRLPRPALWFAVLAWVALVLAAARPQMLGEAVAVPVSGRSLMLAVDISGSMATPDMTLGGRAVSRLTAVKAVAADFIEHRAGDLLGLILFGQRAYLQAPLSFDRETIKTLLLESAVGLAGKETAIGDAIGLAVKRLRDQPEGNRVLILLTDGSNTAGSIDPLKATELAAEEGLRIYTIGIGGDLRAGGFLRSLTMPAELDEHLLGEIAERTGGRYLRARDTGDLQQIYALLDRIEPSAEDARSVRAVAELYTWPLGFALLASVLVVLTVVAFGRSTRSAEMSHA